MSNFLNEYRTKMLYRSPSPPPFLLIIEPYVHVLLSLTSLGFLDVIYNVCIAYLEEKT